MTVIPSFWRCYAYIVVNITIVLVIGLSFVLLADERPHEVELLIGFSVFTIVGLELFPLAAAALMMAILQFRIEVHGLTRDLFILHQGIRFDEIRSVHWKIFMINLSPGWLRFQESFTIPALYLFDRQTQDTVRQRLQILLSDEHLLGRYVRR